MRQGKSDDVIVPMKARNSAGGKERHMSNSVVMTLIKKLPKPNRNLS